jgi:flagella basal body P-ring formation protein FlgA
MLWALATAWGADPAEAIAEAVADRLAVPVEDVEISELGLPANVPTASWLAELPSVGPLWGHVPVVLRGAAGEQVLRYTLRPNIRVWRELPVAGKATAAGGRIEVKLRRVALDTLRGADPADPDQDWQARVDLAENAPLTTTNVRPMPAAVEGSAVRIVSGSGRLVVVAPGQLAEDAFLGRGVQVVNLSTRKVLQGVYETDGIVRVGGVW